MLHRYYSVTAGNKQSTRCFTITWKSPRIGLRTGTAKYTLCTRSFATKSHTLLNGLRRITMQEKKEILLFCSIKCWNDRTCSSPLNQLTTFDQPTMPTSAASYSYNTGQTGLPPSSTVSYAGYGAPPAAPGSVATAAAAAPPPPPMAGTDASQYGVRPPLPPGQTTGAEVSICMKLSVSSNMSYL